MKKTKTPAVRGKRRKKADIKVPGVLIIQVQFARSSPEAQAFCDFAVREHLHTGCKGWVAATGRKLILDQLVVAGTLKPA